MKMQNGISQPQMGRFSHPFAKRIILVVGLASLCGWTPKALGQNIAGGGVQGTWQLTSTCGYYGDVTAHGTWKATITLNEAADGSLTGSVQNDPLKPEVWTDATRSSNNPGPMKSQQSGNNVTLVLHPLNWESVLQLNGTLNGSRIDGTVHHYTNDDCTFTMMAVGASSTAAGPQAGGGSLNFFQNALVLGVQTGFVQAVTSSNPPSNPSYLSQVVPTMPSYAAALGLPHDQLDTLIGQLQSGATQAGLTVMNVWNQFQQQLTNRTCTCGNYVANLKMAYDGGWWLGQAEMQAFLGSPGNLPVAVSSARSFAAAVGLPTDGLDAVTTRLQNGAKGCDVAQDLQNIEKQFEQLTNQPCACMQDVNYQPNPGPGMPAPTTGPSQPTAGGTGSGSLTGSADSSTAEVNLTAVGTLDWVHWGGTAYNNYTEVARKAGVAALIGNYQLVGANAYEDHYAQDPRPISWTDGTPLQKSIADTGGRLAGASGNAAGFLFKVQAYTTPRTLRVYVGGDSSGATLTAHLSDGSAPDFTDTTPASQGGYDRNYTVTYSAGSDGQSLIVTWSMPSGRMVSLNAAALALR
jgi:hypothetical protein